MGKLKVILTTLAIVAILGVTVTSTVFSIKGYLLIKESNDEREKEDSIWEDDEEDTENVLIGGVYQILSTKAISDAYISGDDSDLSDEDKVTLEVASAILDEIITDDMSDFEKEKAIYEWICDNVRHDSNGTVAVQEAKGVVDRPYGVLQNKEAVCVGYATTFRLLTNMVGLDCMVMHDTGLGHSWNLVKLDDGCWYIVDCYYDAEDLQGKYMHFNMSQEFALQDHDWDASLYPVANGSKYDYIQMNSVEVADVFECLTKIQEKYLEDEKNAYFVIKNADEKTYDALMYVAYGISERMYSDYYYVSVRTFKNADSNTYIVYNKIVFDNGAGMDNPDVDYEALDEMLNELFGEPGYYEEY